jgi:hypothetical protein
VTIIHYAGSRIALDDQEEARRVLDALQSHMGYEIEAVDVVSVAGEAHVYLAADRTYGFVSQSGTIH